MRTGFDTTVDDQSMRSIWRALGSYVAKQLVNQLRTFATVIEHFSGYLLASFCAELCHKRKLFLTRWGRVGVQHSVDERRA